MKGEAVKPTFFNSLPTFTREEEAKEPELAEDEKHLYNLKTHRGWKVIREFSESLLKDLDQITSNAQVQGLSFEEIGKNAVVADLAKGLIKRILNRVEDAQQVKTENGTK